MPVTLGELAARAGAELSDAAAAGLAIAGVASPRGARTGDIAYVADVKVIPELETSQAAAVLTSATLRDKCGARPCLVAARPRLALAHILAAFPAPVDVPDTIHETAIIHPEAQIAPGTGIGPHAVIERGARIAAGVHIGAGVFVGADAEIGEGALIHPHVYIGPRTRIGQRVILHPGARVGTDGFAYEFDGQRHVKLEHIGRVILEDDVEIGANSTVDRATMGETRIGAGTKIDNLVHIAHNVTVGRACLLVGQVGIAGSVTIGHGVVMGGQVGVADHVTIGDRVQIGAQSGVHADIAAGERVLGTPPTPATRQLRIIAAMLRLPDIERALRALDKRVTAIEQGGDA